MESEEAFDVSLGHLYQRWEAFVPGFHKWFVENKADVFRCCLIAPVHELAHLGSPPEMFTNNPNESANSVLKKWTDFKKSSWPGFIEKLCKLVDIQLTEVDKAVYDGGNYSLVPQFAHFRVDPVKWHSMTASQRKTHLRKMTSDMLKYTCTMAKPGKMSLSATEVELPSIPAATLQNIWAKAERLLNEPTAIVPAPGIEGARMVASDSLSRPHLVKQSESGKFSCDDQCPMWRG